MDLFEILKKNEIFDGLHDDDIQTIAGICSKTIFSPGAVIFEENSTGCEMYILIRGKVDIQMIVGLEGNLATVHVVESGQIFGELSLVDSAPRSATAKAVGETEVFILKGDDFEGLVQKNYRVGYIVMRNIARIVSTRLRERNIKYTETLLWGQLASDNRG